MARQDSNKRADSGTTAADPSKIATPPPPAPAEPPSATPPAERQAPGLPPKGDPEPFWTPSRIAAVVAIAIVAVAMLVVVGMVDPGAAGLNVPSQAWASLRLLLAGLLVLVILVALFAVAYGEAYLAACWILVSRLPGLIAAAWLLAYFAPIAPGELFVVVPLGVGLWSAIAVWLILAVPFRRLAMVATGQTQAYRELVNRYHVLRARLAECPPAGADPGCTPEDATRDEAGRELDLARAMLELPESGIPEAPSRPGTKGALEWATGTGYVAVSEALHRADEALIDLQSPASVVGEALHDMLRLSESTIKNADHLEEALRSAVRHFDPEADRLYFQPQARRSDDRTRPAAPAPPAALAAAAAAPDTVAAPQAVAASAPAAQTASSGVPPELSDAEARAAVREVRHAVNEYRDVRRAGLVRARNRLLRTILVTGIAADTLLALVIVQGVDKAMLASAAGFFLVGGVVGLFNRLRIEGNSGVATAADYGLFDARLLNTFLISGLAGVGGVYLMSAVPGATSVLTPSGTGGVPTPPDLSKVFSAEDNRIGILVAAVFGLTPDLVIGKLRQQTEGLKAELSSTEAAGSKTPSPGTSDKGQ